MIELDGALSSEAQTMNGSIAVVQTEDEIAAVTMAVGGALTGVRAATSTSGPGFSLMAEGIGWAGMNEVPVVVTLYQRGGPSTGLPTRHEQGDLRFALHIGHGDFPRIVLASGDLEEAFYDVTKAFNYAEKYQMPVIHIIDKAMANSDQTYKIFDPNLVKIERGQMLSGTVPGGDQGDFHRFKWNRERGVAQAGHRHAGWHLLEHGRRTRRDGSHLRGPDQQGDDDGQEDEEARPRCRRRYPPRRSSTSTARRTPR